MRACTDHDFLDVIFTDYLFILTEMAILAMMLLNRQNSACQNPWFSFNWDTVKRDPSAYSYMLVRYTPFHSLHSVVARVNSLQRWMATWCPCRLRKYVVPFLLCPSRSPRAC